MTFFSPVSLHFFAARMAEAMAWADSGAGMIPSVRANSTAASNVSFCRSASARMSPLFIEQRHDGRCPVVAQAAGMHRGRDEAVAQGVHLGQRDELARVAEIVRVDALAQRRTGQGLGGNELDLPLSR